MIAKIPIEGSPDAIAYDSGKGELFVAYTTKGVSVISDRSNTVVAYVTNIPKSPYNAISLVYDSGKNQVFAAIPDFPISVISDSTNTVIANLNLTTGNSVMAYDSAKSEIFVTNAGSGTVTVLSDQTAASTSHSPTTSVSPDSTVPEFSTAGIILVIAMLLVAVAVQSIKSKD